MRHIKFRIISHDPEQHSIIVRYYSEALTEEVLAVERTAKGKVARCRTDTNINLPYPLPSDAALIDQLKACAPIEWFEHMERGPAKNEASLKPLLRKLAGMIHTTSADEVMRIREPKPQTLGSDQVTNKRFSPRVRRI